MAESRQEAGTGMGGARTRGGLAIALAYLAAGFAAGVVWLLLQDRHSIQTVFAADVAATLVVFLFSVTFDNSSFYDAYWSVAPIPIALYWALAPATSFVDPTRQLVVVALVCAWGLRLTWNWWRAWGGIGHEDWRYLDKRNQLGVFYWPVSLLGIHLLSTLFVFLGCLSLYPALSRGDRPFGWLDALAILVTAGAIALEAVADRQLHDFRASNPPANAVLQSGLWSRSRHPNYLGEILFWWGLYLFGLAADPTWWWTIVGPLSISVMFRVVSLPMIEERMLARRPAFADVQQRIPIMVPRLFPRTSERIA
jgi:steroid 5-alpha reductase family enzyme